jgi:hypothetical protein
MEKKYKIKLFNNNIPINYYVSKEDRELIIPILKRFGLEDYVSVEVFHYKWTMFCTFTDHTWAKPTKDSIELVFNLTLADA